MTLVNLETSINNIYPAFKPSTEAEFLHDVVTGLSQTPKQIPCKYLYDERGSVLFTEICRTREYYITRTELTLLKKVLPEIAELIGSNANIIEYGAGDGRKIRELLSALHQPKSYTAIDISREILLRSTHRLKQEFPAIAIHPLIGDYMEDINLPDRVKHDHKNKRVVFFPGSTISNFDPQEAVKFLTGLKKILRPEDGLLMGVDLIKAPQRLHEAYNDREGVTADFNCNLLRRVNEELDGNFNLSQFHHYAFYNPLHSRIEMHLISSISQSVTISGHIFKFRKGESIHTENSYKYTTATIAELARQSGFKHEQVWKDEKELFSINYLTR